ncbi:hypothetical protein ACFORO_11635 [Amycolatopsis halotolerans]|uniref:Uncharacterized protein n=1 Tax=Amycolatopsis halotolerans TaxID=330083 RepID=A0ABV7QDL7_9PSEU
MRETEPKMIDERNTAHPARSSCGPSTAVSGSPPQRSAEETVDLRPGGLVHLPPSMPRAVEAVADSRLSLTLPAG